MLHKTKSVLIKLLLVLCAICCAAALAFGLVGCSDESESVKGISEVKIEDGCLVIYYTDDSSVNLGTVVGSDGTNGTNGTDGTDGTDGVGIESVDIVDGRLIITYTTGDTHDAGAISTSSTSTDAVASITKNEDGDIVVTYINGNTETIDLDGCECGTCEHSNSYDIVISEMSCADEVDGVVLSVCQDCGYSHVYVTEWAHDFSITKTASATCTVDGYTAKACSVCGAETEKVITEEATGHLVKGITITQADIANVKDLLADCDPTYYVAEDGETVCENGGWAVYACEYCNASVWAYEVGALGHVVGDDYKLVAPTTTTTGSLTFTCTRCGTYKSIVLPKLVWVGADDEVTYYEFDTTGSEITYTIEDEDPWCTDDSDLTISFVYADTKFEFTATISHWHVLTADVDGVLANSFFKHNVELDINTVYDWDLVKDYATQLVDTTITCQTPNDANASIKCSVCGDQIYIKVKTSHSTNYEDVKDLIVVDDEPTCEGTGTGHYICPVSGCGEVVNGIVIPATGHGSVEGYEFSNPVISQIDGSLTVSIKCLDCEKDLGTVTFEQGEYTYTTSGTASCETATDNTYSFVYEGKSYTIYDSTEALAHAYVGEDGNLVNIDRKKVYTSDTYGLTVSWQSAGQIICQDDDITGTFTCYYCGKNVVVSVKDPHKYEATNTIYIVASDDDKLGSSYITVAEFEMLWANTVAEDGSTIESKDGVAQLNTNAKYVLATSSACTEASVSYAYCSVCKCWITETDEATGHIWTWTVDDDPTETQDGVITITCVSCGTSITGTLPNLSDEVWSIDEDASYDADCSMEGLDVYVSGDITVTDEEDNSGTVSGVIVEVVRERSTSGHTYGSTIHFTVSEGAYDYHYTADVCEECGNMYDVTLVDQVPSQPFQDSSNN